MIFFVTIIFCVFAFVAFLLTEKGKGLRDFLHFFITGLDNGFSFKQILLLGKIGRSADLENRSSLYWSVPALDRCTAEIIRQSKEKGTENHPDTQKLLADLYKYRTTMTLEELKKKRGIDSTRDINPGQRIRIVLKGAGMYASRILSNNGTNLMIDYPYAPASSPMPQATSFPWIGKEITVYFWRQEDAGYEFDTTVLPVSLNLKETEGRAVLYIAHTRKLLRTQKRRSVRVKCAIYAQLYVLPPLMDLNTDIEPEAGMKCLLEDLSESGAMILIGGKASKDMNLKIQFTVNDNFVVMAGHARSIDFNKVSNQSRIHFECEQLPERMKNTVLTFVYNVLPETDKQEFDAIRLSEEDSHTEVLNTQKNPLPVNEDPLPELPDFASS